MNKVIKTLFASLALLATTSQAALITTELEYNGGSETLAAGAFDLQGTSIQVGDTLNATISAINNDYWTLTADSTWIIDAAFELQDGGTRTVNSTISFWLDGVLQDQHSVAAESQQFIHIGGPNVLDLLSGLTFDQVVLNVELIASNADNVFTKTGLNWNWYGLQEVDYVRGQAVSEPWALALFATGLVLMGRRRKA